MALRGLLFSLREIRDEFEISLVPIISLLTDFPDVEISLRYGESLATSGPDDECEPRVRRDEFRIFDLLMRKRERGRDIR